MNLHAGMKTLPLALAVIVVLSFAARAESRANALKFQLPSGPLLDGLLEVIDESSGRWINMQTQTSQSEDSGFTGSFQTPSAAGTELRGKFEKSGDSLECSIDWEGSAGVPEAFMMLVLLQPVDSFKSSVIQSGERVLSMAKIAEDIPTANTLRDVQSLTMGPVDGKTVTLSSPNPLSLEIKRVGEEFHIRIYLTPKKSALPASGSVQWTMSAQ